MVNQETSNEIRTQPCPACYLCGGQGSSLYEGLRDRLFGATGNWNLKKCQNPECGLLWLDSMPVEEDIGKAYQNYFTHQDVTALSTWPHRVYRSIKEGYLGHKYGFKKESFTKWKHLLGILIYLHPVRRSGLDYTFMCLPRQHGERLLDVGCGSGSMLKQMQSLGWCVEGVDVDPIALENAKSKGLKVRLGKLEDQMYLNNCFDAITMSHLIEHVYDPLQLLRECHRILKPSGHLLVVTPNSESLGHRMFKDNWLGLDPPRHLHLFTPSALYQLAERAGFSKPKISTMTRGANGSFLASRDIQRTGIHVMDSHQPKFLRIWAEAMSLVEWMISKANPNIGEEIALVAEK